MKKKLLLLFFIFSLGYNTLSASEIYVTNKNYKKNNDMDKMNKNDILKHPQVLKLIEESYQKGYNEGSTDMKNKITKNLYKMEKHMDEIFNFHRLYLEGKLMPPRIGVVKTPVQVMKGGKVMILDQEHLEILEPAKFVEETQDWKNMLW